jgi:hypothetical protein
MAQTGKRRRRKHRGTQGGRVDPNRRSGRPRSREEAKARARTKRATPRVDAPPTWRSAITRGLIAAAIFTVLLLLLFHNAVGAAIGIGAIMLLFYIPAGYYIDTMMWRRRERARMRAAQKK